jgi:hypothetical protein
MVCTTWGSHGALMWWWQPQDMVRYTASFAAYNLYIVTMWCLVNWATILRGLVKEELVYVKKLNFKWRPCLQGVMGMSLPHWMMFKCLTPFSIYICPVLSMRSHWVPLTTFILWTPQADGAQCPLTFRASMDDLIHMPNLPPPTFRQMTL